MKRSYTRNKASGRRDSGVVWSVSIVIAAVLFGGVAVAVDPQKSINSTSQNLNGAPPNPVSEVPREGLPGYQIVAANDLGMHCGDLDQRLASILPPFNVLHAQVIRKGSRPAILDPSQVEVVYSAASNPQDPALARPIPAIIYKTNFWEKNERTGNPNGYDALDAYYPPGILKLFALFPDIGLPVPDLQELYLGGGGLVADQQAMPSAGPPFVTQPFFANVPQRFALFYRRIPFFISFPFGYTLSGINWFSAEGVPATPFDDSGRLNAYPVMRVQARAISGNTLGVSAGQVMASLDTVTPVSGEVDCKNCHTSAFDGGNGLATDGKGFTIATRRDDPKYGTVPEEVSIEYAYDLNVLRLHDRKHGTNLEFSTPVSCQRCHYTPALDLAHVGPKGLADPDANGREQITHQSFSRVMHSFHGKLTVSTKRRGKPQAAALFPAMPPPNGRSEATRDSILLSTCYQCHPGRDTQCFRGAMFDAGLACQDCHGNMTQVGEDFSRNVSQSNPGAFILRSDFYTNSTTPRVPWANEPLCQSCHTGDVLNNLANSANVVKSPDGLRLLQAYRTSDANVKPIVATNRRFAENQSSSKQVLYRLSVGHGGVFCEGCHGSTHAEWPNRVPNANDNLAATQLQGFHGKLTDCKSCHGDTPFSIDRFKGNIDSNGWMRGPHGMHPVDDRIWTRSHKEVFEDGRSPAGICQSCHGAQLEGSVLAKLPVDRTLECKETNNQGCRETSQGKRIFLAKGTMIGCSLCHENPSRDR